MSEERAKERQWNSDAVRELRRRLGVTQSQLARRLGVRQQTVSEWETGLYAPRGASVTLLRMVSEEAGPEYRTDRNAEAERDDQ